MLTVTLVYSNYDAAGAAEDVWIDAALWREAESFFDRTGATWPVTPDRLGQAVTPGSIVLWSRDPEIQLWLRLNAPTWAIVEED